MPRFWKILLIVLISFPLLIILIIALTLARGFYVKNRYEVQAISMEWILPVEPGSSACIDFRRINSPAQLQGIGIALVMDLKLVSDSSKGTHKLLGYWRPGGDGAKDSLVDVALLLKEPNGSIRRAQAGQYLLDAGVPCFKDVTQRYSPQQAAANYHWGDLASIHNLDHFKYQFNSGRGVEISTQASRDADRIAFFLWPDAELTSMLASKQQLGMEMSTQKGRTITTWLGWHPKPVQPAQRP